MNPKDVLDQAAVLIQTALGLALTVLVGLAGAFVRTRIKAILADIEAGKSIAELNLIHWVISTLVSAAEQMWANSDLEDRKAYVLARAQEWLTGRGINFDVVKLEALIEAEVLRQFNRDRAISGDAWRNSRDDEDEQDESNIKL
jgi:hypothetical protein